MEKIYSAFHLDPSTSIQESKAVFTTHYRITTQYTEPWIDQTSWFPFRIEPVHCRGSTQYSIEHHLDDRIEDAHTLFKDHHQ